MGSDSRIKTGPSFREGTVRTRDIGGTAKAAEFADAIIQKMNQ